MQRSPCRFLSLSSLKHAVLRRGLLAVFVSLTSATALAQITTPAIHARSWTLVDLTSNQVLASADADARVEPASLTKLMTAYLIFQALQSKQIAMDEIVLPGNSVRTVGTDESRMFIEANKPVTVRELVFGLIVQSGNDAAIALAELVGGSQAKFVNLMNDEAERLGMTHTHFADVNGMPDPQHYTSTSDLAMLTAHLIEDFPEYYPIFSVKSFTYDGIRQPNRNRLLWLDPSVDGLKTGHTKAAGYCLIASAKRAGPNATRRVISVVMGEPTEEDRVRDSIKLLDFAYQEFEEVRFYGVDQAIQPTRVYEGAHMIVEVGVSHELVATVPIGTRDKVKVHVTVDAPLVAPLTKGQHVGTVTLVANGETLSKAPLVTLWPVPRAGIIDRAWDSMLLLFGAKG